jgi:hypothetical protein
MTSKFIEQFETENPEHVAIRPFFNRVLFSHGTRLKLLLKMSRRQAA